MKRFLCVLFVAVFAVTLGFAQELKLDGYINSGLGLRAISDKNTYPDIRVFGVDSEQPGGRFRLNGSYSNADKNVGANFRLQLQGANTATGALGPSYAYGWVKPVEMLQIKAGIVDDSTWETGGAWLKDDQGEGAGVLFRLTPIEGLDLGFGAYVWSQEGSGNNNIIQTPGAMKNWQDAKYTFMASYTMPEVFKINVSGRNLNTTGNNSAQVIGELRLLMVKDLTAVIEFQMDNLYSIANKFDEFSKTGYFNLYETIAYSMDDLKFGLNAGQYFSNNTGHDDAGLVFSPWVSYALAEGKIVPRLDAAVFLGGHQYKTNYDRRNEYKASTTANRTGTYNFDDTTFSVRPSVKLFFDSRNFMEIGNAFYSHKNKGNDAEIINFFYLDFVVRF